MSEDDLKIAWQDYEANRIRHSEIFDRQIEILSGRAYEYGILSVKNLMLMAGGALIAMPAIAGMSEEISVQEAAASARFLVGALVLSFLSCYLIHLNWHFNAAVVQHEKDKRDAQIVRLYFPEYAEGQEEDAYFDKKISRAGFIVQLTYPTPHLAGIIALICFITACFSLFAGIEAPNGTAS